MKKWGICSVAFRGNRRPWSLAPSDERVLNSAVYALVRGVHRSRRRRVPAETATVERSELDAVQPSIFHRYERDCGSTMAVVACPGLAVVSRVVYLPPVGSVRTARRSKRQTVK